MKISNVRSVTLKKKAISDVALSAASQLIKKEMDEETQKQFVEDFIEQAGDKQW